MRALVLIASLLIGGAAHADSLPCPDPDCVPVPCPHCGHPVPQTRYVDHNGSLMVVKTNGYGSLIIRYVQPRPSLFHWGVVPGTVLFQGQRQGNLLVGTAYVFGCGPIPYQVSGAPDRNGVLVLQGLTPIVPISPFCGVIGWDWTANSHLVFLPR